MPVHLSFRHSMTLIPSDASIPRWSMGLLSMGIREGHQREEFMSDLEASLPDIDPEAPADGTAPDAAWRRLIQSPDPPDRSERVESQTATA